MRFVNCACAAACSAEPCASTQLCQGAGVRCAPLLQEEALWCVTVGNAVLAQCQERNPDPLPWWSLMGAPQKGALRGQLEMCVVEERE